MHQIPQNAALVYPVTRVLLLRLIDGRATSCLFMRRCGFEMLAYVLLTASQALGRAGFALMGELFVQSLEHDVVTVIGTQPQNPATGVLDHASSLEHDLLHHRLHAPALGCMAQGCVFADERILANQTQVVHRHRRHGANQKVGVKLATGQTLQIHVVLELRVELLVRSVVLYKSMISCIVNFFGSVVVQPSNS